VSTARKVSRSAGQVAQHAVAGRVAVAVVDVLEVIGVEQDQGQRARRVAARSSSSSAASKKARRLASEVRWSQNTAWRRFSLASRLSLMSRRIRQ
jgi:hypothetical protein